MSPPTPPIISVNHLKKHFRVYKKEAGLRGALRALWKREHRLVKAVDDISFTINPGEIVGFIGQNGAGKTTTLKVLSGLLYPTAGTVSVMGFNPWQRSNDFRRQFSLIMGQKSQLWWDLPPLETFRLNQAIYQIPETQFQTTLKELAKLLDVEEVLQVQVRKLSLGQRMKCELIAALLHTPRVLFLDEPTIGLDVVMQKVLRDFIRTYNERYQATIILTSHYMGDVRELCSRAIMIDRGKKIFDGQLQEIVTRYARNKILSLVFAQSVSETELARFGTVKEYDQDGLAFTATLLVPRERAAQLAAQVMTQLPIQDLTIEEPPIDSIIREFFLTENKTKFGATCKA